LIHHSLQHSHDITELLCVVCGMLVSKESFDSLVVGAVAGLDFECPAGMIVENSGNVPVSFHSLGNRAYAAAGTPCQSDRLEPRQTVYCDFKWSLSNTSVETGEEMVYLAVSGTDLEANGTFAETFTGFGWLSPISVPTMDVKLEALPSAPGDPSAGESDCITVFYGAASLMRSLPLQLPGGCHR
jgi:hypothetical protein